MVVIVHHERMVIPDKRFPNKKKQVHTAYLCEVMETHRRILSSKQKTTMKQEVALVAQADNDMMRTWLPAHLDVVALDFLVLQHRSLEGLAVPGWPDVHLVADIFGRWSVVHKAPVRLVIFGEAIRGRVDGPPIARVHQTVPIVLAKVDLRAGEPRLLDIKVEGMLARLHMKARVCFLVEH